MTVTVKKKNSGEIIQISAYSVAFDSDWFGIWYSADDLHDCEIFEPEDWQILEVSDE